MKAFDYFSPKNMDEAFDLLIKYGNDAKLMAGGTDLIPQMKNEEINPKVVIDLKRIPDLNHITSNGKQVKIGACVTIREIEISSLIQQSLKTVAEAASQIGSVQVRNKGTIGGNLCHASPSADLAPALIAFDGNVKIVGRKGERKEKIEDFLLGPGMTILQPDEIVTEIQIPAPSANTGGVYLKFSPREAMDLAMVGVATLVTLDSSNYICTKARIVLGAVAPMPIRIKNAEKILEGKKIGRELIREVSIIAVEEAKPISDIRGSDWYRKEIIKVLVEQGIHQAIEKAKL